MARAALETNCSTARKKPQVPDREQFSPVSKGPQDCGTDTVGKEGTGWHVRGSSLQRAPHVGGQEVPFTPLRMHLVSKFIELPGCYALEKHWRSVCRPDTPVGGALVLPLLTVLEHGRQSTSLH